MRYILLALVMCVSAVLNAQNLIVNPGFEIIDTSYVLPNPPIDTFDLHNVVAWFNPTYGTTDYYNSDEKHSYCGSRFFGRDMTAHTGAGFGGIFIEKSVWKEYIACNFSDTLKGGQNYRFTMWIAVNPKSRYAMSTLQIEFWDVPWVNILGIPTRPNIYPRTNPNFNTIIIPGTARASMVSTWTKVSVDFTAVGGETTMIIGYFADYWQSVSMPETSKNKINDAYCYYYFDDLELVPFDGPPIPKNGVNRPIIYFDTDKDIIRKQYLTPLDSVVTVMKQNAAMKIIVNGFTDSVGNVEDNLDLSRRRAEAVKKYLVDHGIAETRITTAWYAESRPAGDENAINRRVEFVYVRP